MISITNEIIEYLKEQDDYFIKPKDIRDSYSDEKPVFPMILVDEVINNTQQMIKGHEIYSNIGYKIEIYTKDIAIDQDTFTRSEVALKLGNTINHHIMNQFGLMRIGNPTIIPSIDDNSVIRYILNYSGVINNETGFIYQI